MRMTEKKIRANDLWMQALHKTKKVSVINLWDKCTIVYIENKVDLDKRSDKKKKAKTMKALNIFPEGKRYVGFRVQSIKAGYLSVSL